MSRHHDCLESLMVVQNVKLFLQILTQQRSLLLSHLHQQELKESAAPHITGWLKAFLHTDRQNIGSRSIAAKVTCIPAWPSSHHNTTANKGSMGKNITAPPCPKPLSLVMNEDLTHSYGHLCFPCRVKTQHAQLKQTKHM